MKKEQTANIQQQPTVKRGRGRPKKVRSQRELKKIEKAKKNKLTLAEKQAIKLKIQRERQAKKIAAGESEPKNKDRFYCTNKDLQAEQIKWRDSNKSEEENQYKVWQSTHTTEKQRRDDPFIIDYTKRKMSEELGKMMIAIADKVLNHSNFRNYSKELKEDMRGFFFYKIIKGLKNYNFEFNNPFAFFTQAAFNAYITVIGRHYKHQNIRKDLFKKLLSELETYNGISPMSSLNKYIKTYLGDEIDV